MSLKFLYAENLVQLMAIDRVTGKTFKLLTPINKESNFERLVITPKLCYKSPPEKQPENASYIIIKEKGKTGYIFEGWMFSSSPSLNPMEHPVYDVWLLGCKNKID